MAIESPAYTVTLHDGLFEIREYPPLVAAVVTVDGTRAGAVNSGFRLLADYIFGNNQQKSKIAMTAPVTQSGNSTQFMPMAADSASWTVSFIMPAGYTVQSLPAPNSQRVRFERVPARRVAAVRFSGFWSDSNLESHATQLVQWIQKQHLTTLSAPTFAYYDPPWKPWFLRRIEVLIEVSAN